MTAIASPSPDPSRRPKDGGRSARLNLTITERGSARVYDVRAVQNGKTLRAWRLRRPGEADHLVSSDGQRGPHCTCGERLANPQGVCVHIGAMRAMGLIEKE